jgi:hypothetical protein
MFGLDLFEDQRRQASFCGSTKAVEEEEEEEDNDGDYSVGLI